MRKLIVPLVLLVLAGCSPQKGFGGYVEVKALHPESEETVPGGEIELSHDVANGMEVFTGVELVDDEYTFEAGIRFSW